MTTISLMLRNTGVPNVEKCSLTNPIVEGMSNWSILEKKNPKTIVHNVIS